MSKGNRKLWMVRAEALIGAYENADEPIAMFSVTSLAVRCGVSRSTLWRQSSLRSRLTSLTALKRRAHVTGDREKKKGRNECRVERLIRQVECLTKERDQLIKLYLQAYSRLIDRHIDPADIFGQSMG